MTTAHRPTLELKRGKETSITNTISHAGSLPAYKQLKYRKNGQGGMADAKKAVDELKVELLRSERDHYLKTKGSDFAYKDRYLDVGSENQGYIEDNNEDNDNKHVLEQEDESYEQKRRRILQETQALDTDEDDDDDVDESESEEEDSDSEDETEQLMKELAKLKKEKEEERIKQELLQSVENENVSNTGSFQVKRTWRNETIFKNQHAPKKNPQDSFINDALRSDFHKKFLSRFVQ